MFKRILPNKLTGNEKFINTDTELSILDFWKYAFSSINSNIYRGVLAEFLVETALKDLNNISIRNTWEDYDVLYKNLKIEVKCSSYIQDWDQKKLSKPVFSGLKANKIYLQKKEKQEKNYKADIYVLVLLKEVNPNSLNLLDLEQYDFFVLSKSEISKIAGNKSNLPIIKLIKLEINPVSYKNLKKKITETAKKLY